MSLFRYALIGLVCLYYLALQGKAAKDRFTACTTDDTQDGVCVKKSWCNKPNSTLLDPPTLFTYRIKGCHYLEECCRPNKVVKSEVKVPLPKPSTRCGLSNPGMLVFRDKTEQQYTDYAEFPWMVALLRKSRMKKDFSFNYVGGGSLIHRSVVLTAAHKVNNYKRKGIKCRAGEWDTQTDKEVYPYQERTVKKIITHEQFIRKSLHTDVALLFLSVPFVLAPHIGVACLGRILPPPNTKCYSMGWGIEGDISKRKYAVVLKKIQLPLVGQNQCEIVLRNAKLDSTYTLHKSLMCAGGEEGKDTCIGDGGSPLVCPIENPGEDQLRYAVYGIVAFGIGCGVKDVPGVYVNVPQMYQWIEYQIMLNGLTSPQFDY